MSNRIEWHRANSLYKHLYEPCKLTKWMQELGLSPLCESQDDTVLEISSAEIDGSREEAVLASGEEKGPPSPRN
jgi:hypothetical protein